MRQRFYLFKRKGIFYLQDTRTGEQKSLQTRHRSEAEQILQAKGQADRQPFLNMAIAKVHLAALDPNLAGRTWTAVMEEFVARSGRESTRRREQAMQSREFDLIRRKRLVETTSDDSRIVLRKCGAFNNASLRCLQKLAVGLGWLPWPILPPKLWPRIKSKQKRAITSEEHTKIVQGENNLERRLFYELLWETGASQSDAAELTAEAIDWNKRTLSFQRKKTGEWCFLEIGSALEKILRQLPARGPIFPSLSRSKDVWRSAEFSRRCRLLKITGVSLHSYRYA